MDNAHISAVLASAEAKDVKDGFSLVPEGRSITFYVAHAGASLSVPRAIAVKVEGQLLHARTQKGETYVVEAADVFGAAIEGGSPTTTRKAGFL